MSKKYIVTHKKSKVVNDGVPKIPSASMLEYGEIAINYADGYETLSIKNDSDEIVTFPGRSVVENIISSSVTGFLPISSYTEDERVVIDLLNDLDTRLDAVEGTPIPSKTSDLTNDSGFVTSAHTHSQYSTTAHTHTATEVGAMATNERSNYLTTATTIPSVENYFDDVEYDSSTKRINFKHGNTVKDYIDATDFIKDGMVSSVTISDGNLVITFNTDAGKEDIELSLSQIFNPNNYYTKTETNAGFLTTATTIPSKTSDLINDSSFVTTADTQDFITGYTETDPTVPAWAKAASKPSYTAAEVGAMATGERSNYATTAHTHDQYSLTSHTHSQYSTTAHTHTAAEVGAMATSERGNYLTTATTIPTEASIEASGFTKNALTGYTETDPTVPAWAKAASKPSYTASEVGAMATSERSNYSTTAHTHSQYATTAHTHTAAEVGAMATSERSNYLTTATTIPTETSIENSGFTKNGITGINLNGTAVTVTNGIAEMTVQGGGSSLPAVTTADNGKVLMVVDGVWSAVTPTVIYTGTGTPQSTLGNDGDIYLQTS